METNEVSTEGMTPEEATRLIEVQARVDRGAEKLDADLGPIWRSRILLDELEMASNSLCLLGQLFDDYDDGLEALWPDALRYRPAMTNYCCEWCHGPKADYWAKVKAAAAKPTRDQLAQSHGFLDDEDAGIDYGYLEEVWIATIERLRAERKEEGA